jgi:hypothetical protein
LRPTITAMNWSRGSKTRGSKGLADPLTAQASELTQLLAARERQLAWTRDYAAAADTASALEAFLDADAISAELLE